MIYFIMLESQENNAGEQLFIKNLRGLPAMGFSIGFPKSQLLFEAKYHRYKVNLIYNRQEIEESLVETMEE
jgi:hypothetical protein